MAPQSKQLLAKVSKPILNALGEAIDRACLRRDAYLDHVFAHEANLLLDEIPHGNSREARAYLQSKLDEFDRVPVNFSLSEHTINAVNRACDDRNVIRDCFINRVLFLLVFPAEIFEAITGVWRREDLGEILGDNDRDFLCAPLLDGSLDAISGIVSSDPFQALRNVIRYRQGQGDEDVEPLHAFLIRPELFSNRPPGAWALNCYLSDEQVPGSPTERSLLRLEEVFGKLVKKSPNISKVEVGRETAE